MNVCENPDILRVIWFGLEIVDIVKIIIPIALIVLGIIDFSKSVITSDEGIQKKSGKLFLKRIIYAVLVFIVPWLIKVFIITLGDLAVLKTNEVNFTDCLDNANGEKIEELEKKMGDEKNNLACWKCNDNNNLYKWGTSSGNNTNCHAGWHKVDLLEKDCGIQSCYECQATGERYWGTINNKPDSYCPNSWITTNESKEQCNKGISKNLSNKEDETLINNASKGNDVQTDGLFIGTKYDLTEKQLKSIARLCQQEQGSAVGAAVEASLMANRFELFGSKYGSGAEGLYNYVAYSKWFAGSKKYMGMTVDKNGEYVQSEKSAKKIMNQLRDDVYTAVYEVLNLGKRKLPLYVDEHDCIDCGKYGFDVVKIVTGGTIITKDDKKAIKNHDNYVRDKTIIYNRYKSEYTFYTFPTKSSDPFGYTASAKNKYAT